MWNVFWWIIGIILAINVIVVGYIWVFLAIIRKSTRKLVKCSEHK